MKGFCYSLKTPFKNLTAIVLLVVFIAICFFPRFGDVVICINETHMNLLKLTNIYMRMHNYKHACRHATCVWWTRARWGCEHSGLHGR